MIREYIKKPIKIRAVQWDGTNLDECMKFMGQNGGNKVAYEDDEEQAKKTGTIYIQTLEGIMECSKGDYIIQGIEGEFYPCKPEIFVKSYVIFLDD